MIRFETLEDRRLFSTLTANFNAPGGALKKAGLGSLFGVANIAGGTNQGLIRGSTLTNSAPADTSGVTSTNPFSLANIASILRTTGAKTIVRYADMLSGFPYNWVSVADWDSKVTGETTAIKNNFSDVVRAIAPFNEPDNSFAGNFMTDPAIPVSGYNNRVDWLWTHTFQKIRSIDTTASIPIMGPNWLSYYPQSNANDQPRMQTFLQNAKNTSTVPDIMAWHQLFTGSPSQYGDALNNYYRPLESSFGLPKLPLVVEEYGFNNGKFTGIPSALIPFWAEYERDGVDYGSAGVYDNGATLGNEVDHFSEKNQQPNAGWWAANWFMNMAGQYIPTSTALSRGSADKYEGIASFNPNSKTATLLLGGPDDQATITLQGIAAKMGTSSVRVQLDDVRWTEDTDTGEPGLTLEHGGDPVVAPTQILNQVFTADASGNLDINFHLEDLHAYKMTITPSTTNLTPRYEAENALGVNVVPHLGADATLRSNGGYVGGINGSTNTIAYTVFVPSAGNYNMTLTYGAAAAATQALTVNNVAQTALALPSTGGYLNVASGTVVRSVPLVAGVNTIKFAGATGFAEHDFISIATPQTKYEAESATRTNVTTYTGATLASDASYVGGINSAASTVAFNVNVATKGFYDLNVRYAASGAAATHTVSINGLSQGVINYDATAGWSNTDLLMAHKMVLLNAGANTITFSKGTNFAELDFIDIQPNTHRYEAETATTVNSNRNHFPNAYTYPFYDDVVGMNATNSGVTFTVQAPLAGVYALSLGYGNGGGNASDSITVNGGAQGSISLPTTIGYLGSVGPDGNGVATATVNLAAGTNTITLLKVTNFAEFNYLSLTFNGSAAPMMAKTVQPAPAATARATAPRQTTAFSMIPSFSGSTVADSVLAIDRRLQALSTSP